MARKSCQFPDDCGAGRRGLCAKCGRAVNKSGRADGQHCRSLETRLRMAAAKKVLWSDPAWRAQEIERRRQRAAARNGYYTPPGWERTVRIWRQCGLTAEQIAFELARPGARPLRPPVCRKSGNQVLSRERRREAGTDDGEHSIHRSQRETTGRC